MDLEDDKSRTAMDISNEEDVIMEPNSAEQNSMDDLTIINDNEPINYNGVEEEEGSSVSRSLSLKKKLVHTFDKHVTVVATNPLSSSSFSKRSKRKLNTPN